MQSTLPKTWQILLFSTVILVGWGLLLYLSPLLCGVGLAIVMVSAGIVGWRQIGRAARERSPSRKEIDIRARTAETIKQDADHPEDLIGEMLSAGRYALLLRPQIIENLAREQSHRALEELDQRMALVPDGEVILRATLVDPTDDDEQATLLERTVHVEPLFLDRFPVTNQQYQAFVAGGGYEQISLWDPTVWPAILDFVDQTGHPGPRYWKNKMYAAGTEEHPVVGVSWYEAAAYARWVGKRLPTDPEWVKAGSWPVQVPGSKPLQRKHPWGDTMDRTQANLWGSGPGKTTPVHQFHNGGTVGGVYQLVGNVWEWTTSNYGAWNPALRRVESQSQMKSIRGGAYDTYFDSQANCQFQSGDSPMSRKHNIGFRCALSVCDLGEFNTANEAAVELPAQEETSNSHPLEVGA